MIKAGSLVKDFFARRNLSPGSSEKEVLDYTGIWESIVGENIGRNTRPLSLKGGVLYVEVADSVWLYELTLLKSKIIGDFNAAAGEKVLLEIVFRNMGIALQGKQEGGRSAPGPAPPQGGSAQGKKEQKLALRAKEKTEIARLTRHLSEPLRPGMERLLCSFFLFELWKKEQGAGVCPRCRARFFAGAAGEQLCPFCTREQKKRDFI